MFTLNEVKCYTENTLMKKLIILPVVVLIFFVSLIMATKVSAAVTCSWDRAQINVNQPATLIMNASLADNPLLRNLRIVVTAQYNDGTRYVVVSEPITLPTSGTVNREYNVFNRDGRYKVALWDSDGPAHCGGTNASDTLTVGSVIPPFEIPPDIPPPPNTCPSFANFSSGSNQFTADQEVGIGFTPLSGHNPHDYVAALYQPGDTPGEDNPTMRQNLVQFGSAWVANFGHLEAVTGGSDRSYNVLLVYSPNVIPPQNVRCGEWYFFVEPLPPLDDCNSWNFNHNNTWTDEAADIERHFNEAITDDNRRYDINGDGSINDADKNLVLRCEVLLPTGHNPCRGGICKTALGDIPTDITSFAGRVLAIAIGIAGGIALILLVFGSIRVLTSSGDQQRLAGGRDTIVAAIAGLLFLIFSVLILRALGLAIGISFL